MKNKQIIFVLTIFVSVFYFSFLSFDKNPEKTTRWQKVPINIDGNSDEWKLFIDFYHSETKLKYGISNDSTYVYFCFISADPVTQLKLLSSEITVSFASIVMAKKERHGIKFQNKSHQIFNNEGADMISKHDVQFKTVMHKTFQNLDHSLTDYDVLFKTSPQNIENNKNEIKIKGSFQQENYVLELGIPLEQLFGYSFELLGFLQKFIVNLQFSPIPKYANLSKEEKKSLGKSMSSNESTTDNESRFSYVNESLTFNTHRLYKKESISKKMHISSDL